jgi:putative nucleotidyltransferase with HDIG domain
MRLPGPLPEAAQRLLRELDASPRLIAHLTVVHDMARALAQAFDSAWPALPYDRNVVFLGAALHDIGKVVHPAELTAPGSMHEASGEELLLSHGFAHPVARIARAHGQWDTLASPPIEDLLVALADAVWKGQRNESLERVVVSVVSAACGEEVWTVYLKLDDALSRLAEGAEERLAWYAGHAP